MCVCVCARARGGGGGEQRSAKIVRAKPGPVWGGVGQGGVGMGWQGVEGEGAMGRKMKILMVSRAGRKRGRAAEAHAVSVNSRVYLCWSQYQRKQCPDPGQTSGT